MWRLHERIIAAAQAEQDTVVDDSQASAQNEELAFTSHSPELDGLTQAKVESEKERANSHRADTWMKTWLAPKVFSFMQAWCSFVAVIFSTYFLLKNGDVPPEVMIALLTTTTVSIVGLVGFLVQGLFKSRERQNSEP